MVVDAASLPFTTDGRAESSARPFRLQRLVDQFSAESRASFAAPQRSVYFEDLTQRPFKPQFQLWLQ